MGQLELQAEVPFVFCVVPSACPASLRDIS